MQAHELVEIGFTQGIAVERKKRLVQPGGGEADRSSRAERLVLDPILEVDALVGAVEVLLDLSRQITARDDAPPHPVTPQVLERIGEQRPVDEGEHVLARTLGQRP